MSETIDTAAAAARSLARVPTPNASRYLQQLCKHFAHKLPVTFDEREGVIAFSIGEARLEAREGEEVLEMRLAAPDAQTMPQLQDVVARHLLRFAFREELAVDWQPA